MATDEEHSESSLELLKEIVTSNHKFTTSIYGLMKESDIIFSPISIQVALLLAYTGAKNQTAQEIQDGLHLDEEKSKILESVSILLQRLENPKLNVATEIFIEQNYKIKGGFKANAEKFFQSNFQLLDFQKAAEDAREVINSWVSDKTKQKIINFIPPGVLDEYTRMVLVNAVHFKDNWLRQFRAENTTDEPFYSTDSEFVNVPMMKITDRFLYIEKEFYKVLELPYEDSHFKMVIFLPKEINGLSKLETELQDVDLLEIFKNMFKAKVNLSLPKFKMEKFISMSDILESVGMKTMFTDDADFSDINHPSEFPLKVSNVLHKAVVEINEEGSEAAAATAVTFMVSYCMPIFDDVVYTFNVNHPFIFYIMHEDIILFAGKKSAQF